MSQGGHIVKPSGKRKTWALIYRDPAGVQQWEGKFKKRTEAQTRLNEVLGAIDKGIYARPSSVTLEKFAEDWLAGRRQIRGSTESGYGSIINKQLVPRLRAIAVSALRFDHIDAAVSGMIEDELSSKTILRSVRLLQSQPGRETADCHASKTCGLGMLRADRQTASPLTGFSKRDGARFAI